MAMRIHMAKHSTVHKVVYFVRHGESEANVAPVFQSPDSPLSERGRHQAQLIGERVSQLRFDALISSPFARARETAQVIAQATEADVRRRVGGFSPSTTTRISGRGGFAGWSPGSVLPGLVLSACRMMVTSMLSSSGAGRSRTCSVPRRRE